MKIEVPVNIGDTIYVVPSKVNFKLNVINGHEENNRVYHQVVDHIAIYRGGYYLSTCDGSSGVIEQSYSENWFLTEEEAQRRLELLDRLCSGTSWMYRKMNGKIKNK